MKFMFIEKKRTRKTVRMIKEQGKMRGRIRKKQEFLPGRWQKAVYSDDFVDVGDIE